MNNNDDKYNQYLDHKIHKKISNDLLIAQLNQRNYDTNSIVEDFECFACQQTVEPTQRTTKSYRHEDICGVDLKYPKMSTSAKEITDSNVLKQGKCEADLLRELILANSSFTQKDFWDEIRKRFDNEICQL